MKIVLTGSNGQLGYDLARCLEERGIECVGLDSRDLDITDESAVNAMLSAIQPNAVIHCAAFTDVDQAQVETERAYAVNAKGTEYIARACRALRAVMMYISTDYVFSGSGAEEHRTDDPTIPLNVYGHSKLLGEMAVKDALDRYFIVRTSRIIGIHGDNFVKRILRLATGQACVDAVADQVGSPTFAMDLAPLLCDMIMSDRFGVYHATNEGDCSWAEFATEILRLSGSDVKVNGITSEEECAKAPKPLNSRLSKESLDQAGFKRLPAWQKSLQRYLLYYITDETRYYTAQIEALNGDLTVERAARESLKQELEAVRRELESVNQELIAERSYSHHLRECYDTISNSASWKITKPVRFTLDKVKQNRFFYTLINNIKGLYHQQQRRLSLTEGSPAEAPMSVYDIIAGTRRVVILCTWHTKYIALLIQKCLQRVDIESEILTDMPEVYEDVLHFVICPNMWERMPGLYISVQLEQTVSSRWLNREYLDKLCNSFAVLDYSTVNIEYFKKNTKFGKMFYYVPVDVYPDFGDYGDEYAYDVVFYGDPNNERRQQMLNELKKDFKVTVISEVFGEALYRELSKAKIIVNIHYYENAMLETTRLHEALSLGRSVIVSERSSDPNEEIRLEEFVDFVDCGDIQKMKKRIAYWLSHEEERVDALKLYREKLNHRDNAFDYYFYRFMLANDWINFDRFYALAGNYVRFNTDRICLSLPEDTERRRSFDADNHFGFEVIPGLRHYRGWTGCGLSYKYIMKKAEALNFPSIVVCEDDVFFPDDFESRFARCLDYLSQVPKWDVFQGLMSNIGDIKLSHVEHKNGQTFVHVDHMISTVFNIYRNSVYNKISSWDERNDDVMRNTIDRALESRKLKIIATAPFLVGHKEDLHSTIWEFGNTQYNDLIADSSKRLEQLIQEFESKGKR